MATVNPLVPVLFASIAMGTASAILAWRERSRPGATPLVGLLAAQVWWSTCIIFKLRAVGIASKLFWTNLGWVGVVAVPVAWLLFALEYTGNDQYVSRRNVALLSLIPAVTVVLVLTTPYHDLLYVQSQYVGSNGVVHIEQGGVWYWTIAGYTYLLGGVAMIPLFALITSEAATFRGQSATLLVGLVAPWATNVLYLVGLLPTSGIDPTPIAFSISGVAFLGALTRFRLLGTSPAPNKRARRFVLDRMREGAIVVDMNDFVVDVNDSGLELLGMGSREVLGAPASAVIPEYERLPEDGPLSGHLTVADESGENPYDVTVTLISNARDAPIGRIITFHDISKHLRQQQRLEVLNRILRHNIRTETNIIHGYVDQFADDEDASIVKERALRIEEIGQKGREAIELFDKTHEQSEPRSLTGILEQCVSSLRREYPEATIEYAGPDDTVAVAGLLDHVFSNAIENAIEHNPRDEPTVWVTARTEGGRVRVDVADDGPGIDAYEVRVLKEGTETSLEHGSGLGLWIIKWGADIADGDVHFSENDPVGSVVTVDVPILGRESGGTDALSSPGDVA